MIKLILGRLTLACSLAIFYIVNFEKQYIDHMLMHILAIIMLVLTFLHIPIYSKKKS